MDNERCLFPCPDEYADAESFENNIKKIYERLSDGKSREIFEKRLLYSFTKDYKYIHNIVEKEDEGARFIKEFKKKGSEQCLYIYGAGIVGTRLPNVYPEIEWAGYIDKNLEGKTCNGLPVYGISTCPDLSSAVVLVSNTVGYESIKSDMVARGYKADNILVLREYDAREGKNQYFDNACVGGVKDKTGMFIDIGCYDGEDTIRYCEWCNDRGAEVMAFEADPMNYSKCMQNLKEYKRVKVCNIGLSDQEGILKFDMKNSPSSRFSSEGNEEVKVVPLDVLMENNVAKFIKIDVEGMEEKVIRGAKKTIERDRPVMAVSIYHRREDIWKLPGLLLQIQPKYHLYLRHYTMGVTDTVLYAIYR